MATLDLLKRAEKGAPLNITEHDNNFTSIETEVNAREEVANKGQANGYCPLDGSALVPVANLPASVTGAVEYKGTWDASLGSDPTGSPEQGFYYVVSVAGSHNLDGITDWKVGDWAIYNGTAWEKVDNTDAVASVFGRDGAVVAAASDYDASQIDNDSGVTGAFVSNALDTLDSGKQNTSEKGSANGYCPLDASAEIPVTHFPKVELTGVTTSATTLLSFDSTVYSTVKLVVYADDATDKRASEFLVLANAGNTWSSETNLLFTGAGDFLNITLNNPAGNTIEIQVATTAGTADVNAVIVGRIAA